MKVPYMSKSNKLNPRKVCPSTYRTVTIPINFLNCLRPCATNFVSPRGARIIIDHKISIFKIYKET